MAKKKFLNLDNMNILWDNIDRNFLRREDIPYVEFEEELLTESSTIIGAINELYRLIQEGVSPTYPEVICNVSSITENQPAITKTVTVTYKNYTKVNSPQVTSGGDWISVTGDTTGDTRTYNIKLTENLGAKRTGSVKFSCTGKNGNADVTISITQNAMGDATINTSQFPSKLQDHTAFSRTYDVTYTNWSTIENATSDSTWMTISKSSENGDVVKYLFSVTENTGNDRTGNLTFKCIGRNGNPITKKVTITQPKAGSASMEFNPNPVEVNWDATEATISVTYNNSSEVLEPSENIAWVDSISKVSNSGNVYTYKISGITKNNNASTREGSLVFKCKDLLGSEIESSATINQKAAPAGTLTVTPTSKTISADGGTITFTVTFGNSEYYWVTKEEGKNWITIPSTDNSTTGGSTSKTYTATVEANTSTSSRTCKLYFRCHGYNNQDQKVEVTITQNAPDVIEQISPMYIGYIPYDSSKFTASQWVNDGYNLITEQMILDGVTNGNITETITKESTADYTGFGDVPKQSLLLIALPQSSNLSATTWNSVEGDMPFSVNPSTNGSTILSISGNAYKLYGERTPYALIKNNEEIYYKIK